MMARTGPARSGLQARFSSYGSRLAVTYVALILLAALAVSFFLYQGLQRVYIDLLADNLARAATVAGRRAGDLTQEESLEQFVTEVADLTGARVTLIAHDGTVLADSEAEASAMENHAGRPEVRTALLGGRGVSIRLSDTVGRRMLYIAVGAGEGLIARLALDMGTVEAAIDRLRLIALLPLLVACGLGVVLALRSAGRLTNPLREMSEVAQAMGAGNLQVRAPVEGPVESAELGRNLNLLAANLQARLTDLDAVRARLETVLRDLPSGVVELDRNYAITGANPAAERMLGFALDRLMGAHYSRLLRSYPLARAVEEALEQGESARLEVETGRDETSAVHVSVSPLREPGRTVTGVVLVIEDLGQTRRDARLRRELVANVSHELKTPVASIRALAETLSAGALSDQDAAARFLGHIERESERLSRLVDDLLELARLEASGTRLERAPLSVSELMAKTVTRFRPLMEQKNIELVLDKEPEDLWVRGDEHYLERALGNLLDNALKFTPRGGRVEVAARAGSPNRDQVEVEVTDTGSGLPAAAAARVFERFYRVGADRSRRAGGTGLGLAIVKHVVQAHGGEVGVSSAGPGLGCRFWMRLPRLSHD